MHFFCAAFKAYGDNLKMVLSESPIQDTECCLLCIEFSCLIYYYNLFKYVYFNLCLSSLHKF